MAEEAKVKRLHVAFDIDGVLFDWDSAAREAFELRGYENLVVSEYWNHLKEQVRAKDWDWLWRGSGLRITYDRPDIEYPGAGKLLRHAGATCDLDLVTHRPNSAAPYTARWLAARGCHFRALHVIGSHVLKSTVVQPDVFVDDKVENVIDMLENGPSHCQVFMPRRVHNQPLHDSDHPRLQVYTSLKEVSQWLKEKTREHASQPA